MKSPVRRRLLVALFALAATVPVEMLARQSSSETTPRFWWRSERVKKDLSLTQDQINRLEKIFQDAVPLQQENMSQLRELEDKLSKMIEKDQPVNRVTPIIQAVESARARVAATRSTMLYMMRKEMTTSQRALFDKLHPKWQQQWEAERLRAAARGQAPGEKSGSSRGQKPSAPAPNNR